MQDMPELAELSKNLIIDQTPEGLRIQIVDQEGRPMFPSGGTEPFDRTKLLLQAIAKVIGQLPTGSRSRDIPTPIRITARTARRIGEISAERANASRRILQANGIPTDRIYSVSGKAASEPLTPEDPYQPANRRISIVLLREAPVLPPGHDILGAPATHAENAQPPVAQAATPATGP